MRCGSALGILGAAVYLTAGLPVLAQSAPPLRSAASFVVLGSSSVENTGVSRVTGNVGVSPGNVVTGLSPGMFQVGDVRRDDALARQARQDGAAAADALSVEPCTMFLGEPALGGRTLRSGVYCFTAPDVQLNGTLILDAEGDRDGVWIFRIDRLLTTASDAAILVIGNGYNGNVFWSAGQASIGERTRFIGNLFALSGIAFRNGASLSGRAFARNGSVLLHANDVSLCCAPLQLAPGTLPDGVLETPYRQLLTASGGMAPYSFTISSGSLPVGLTLTSDGTLEGTPANIGTFAFTVTATDARGCSSTAAYSIGFDCGVRTTLPPAGVGVGYAAPLTFDGVAPFTCSITEGTLSSRWSVPGCILTATPDVSGRFDFVVESTDALGARRSRCLTIDVGNCTPLVVTPEVLPGGTVDDEYPKVTFMVTEGTAPYHFIVSSGTLPPGLDLSDGGTLSGTPTSAGTYAFGIRVTDFYGCSKRLLFCAIDVGASSCPPGTTITLSPPHLPPATPDAFYSQAITAIGGTAPYTYTVPPGALPDFLTLDETTGILSGIATETGTFEFTVTAIDANGCRGSACYVLRLDLPIPTIASWMLFVVAVLLAGAGWITIGRR